MLEMKYFKEYFMNFSGCKKIHNLLKNTREFKRINRFFLRFPVNPSFSKPEEYEKLVGTYHD